MRFADAGGVRSRRATGETLDPRFVALASRWFDPAQGGCPDATHQTTHDRDRHRRVDGRWVQRRRLAVRGLVHFDRLVAVRRLVGLGPRPPPPPLPSLPAGPRPLLPR